MYISNCFIYSDHIVIAANLGAALSLTSVASSVFNRCLLLYLVHLALLSLLCVACCFVLLHLLSLVGTFPHFALFVLTFKCAFHLPLFI